MMSLRQLLVIVQSQKGDDNAQPCAVAVDSQKKEVGNTAGVPPIPYISRSVPWDESQCTMMSLIHCARVNFKPAVMSLNGP